MHRFEIKQILTNRESAFDQLETTVLKPSVHNPLRRAGISTCTQLTAMTEQEVSEVRGIGRVAMQEIKASLAERGMSLKEEG